MALGCLSLYSGARLTFGSTVTHQVAVALLLSFTGLITCICYTLSALIDCLMLYSMFMKGSHVDSPTSEVCTVKILSVDMHALSLDAVIKLMRWFPCLEKLYIEVKTLLFSSCYIYLLF